MVEPIGGLAGGIDAQTFAPRLERHKGVKWDTVVGDTGRRHQADRKKQDRLTSERLHKARNLGRFHGFHSV